MQNAISNTSPLIYLLLTKATQMIVSNSDNLPHPRLDRHGGNKDRQRCRLFADVAPDPGRENNIKKQPPSLHKNLSTPNTQYSTLNQKQIKTDSTDPAI